MKPMHSQETNYVTLIKMAGLSFVAMYLLMYLMVDIPGNVFPNLNQFYMAGIMTATMVVIEIILMGSMYGIKATRQVLIAAGVLVLLGLTLLIRRQVGISDREFLKSMISHHGSAILMCDRAPLEDPEIKGLCREILTSQQSQIDWMKLKLGTLEK